MNEVTTKQYLKADALLIERNAWHEYIALQEIHAYVFGLKNVVDEDKWIYKTAAEWQELFPFWTLEMIHEVLQNLVNMKYLDVMVGREGSTAKCYKVNYNQCL